MKSRPRISATRLPRTRIVALGVALLAIGLPLVIAPARAEPEPKAPNFERLAGLYIGVFTYSGPKGHFDGQAALLILSRTSDRLRGRLTLNPDPKFQKAGWNCTIEIQGEAIDINDAIPFDKGRTGADGSIQFVEKGDLIFVSEPLRFKKHGIEGNARIRWEKDGPDFGMSMTVRTHKGDEREPTIHLVFSGSRTSD